MFVFDHKDFDNHERVSFFHDQKSGLKAIISVHNTHRGPALGGCRMWKYENEQDAITDVLRLSRGMTYKAAVANLPLGGGKSVIIGDSKTGKTPELMRVMGRAVQQMAGTYIIAEDVGTSVEDLVEVAKETDYAVGLEPKDGHGGGDPSPLTAYGVFVGLKSAVKTRLGKTDLTGLKISVQGLGHVGMNLAKHLHDAGARLTVTDINQDAVKTAVEKFGATAVGLDEIYDVDADVYAPCALGAILNDKTLPRLKVSVVAGAANNQLAELRHAEVLKDRNILYAPDYVINAAGLIHVYYEYLARTEGKPYENAVVTKAIEGIADTTETIFKMAESANITTALAADRVAEERFKAESAPRKNQAA